MRQIILTSAVLVLGALTSPALAGDKPMDHGAMQASEVSEVQTTAVIHAIDADAGTINVTHEPIEALGWPKMKMDLPVTRRVDLSSLDEGSNVVITLKKGMDNQFRVNAIEPAE
jgi:Cu/Ag efflux protein CusF